jgi:3-hydroxybutyryl-CoA dehydrogenase
MVLGKRLDKVPVMVADAPGFLVNQVGRGYTIEAAHAVSECVTDFVTADRIMRDTAGFRMGPFELLDLTAIDVTHPATEAIYRQFFDEARYRPSLMMKTRLDAGLLGRKTGRGFYVYEDGKQLVPEEAEAATYDGRAVWISRANPAGADRLGALLAELGGNLDSGDRPGAQSLILLAPLGLDATSAALAEELDPKRAIAVDTLFDMSKRRVLMKTPITEPDFAASAAGLFAADGAKVSLIRDSAGFIAQRLVASIVNIGCSIAQAGTATPEDIDRAVMLGLSYPRGPFGFGDEIGADKILAVLSGIEAVTGDPRYRPTPWLRRRAGLGVSLATPES